MLAFGRRLPGLTGFGASPIARRALATSTSSASSSTGSFVAADQTLSQNKIYHKSHYVSLGLIPLALLAHPSALSLPLDVALSIALPVHAHIGMNWIFTDYVPGSPTGVPRLALAAATALATLGLLKISIFGDGVVGTVKELWTGDVEKKKLKH